MKDYMETEYDSNFSITPFSLDSQHSSSTRNETASANWRGSQSIYVGGNLSKKDKHGITGECNTISSCFSQFIVFYRQKRNMVVDFK